MQFQSAIAIDKGGESYRSRRAPGARYGRIAIVLHWLVAVLLAAQLTLGWWMLGLPKQPPGLRAGWFNLHKSIGITLGVLVLVRLAWRLTHRPPALPRDLGRWQRAAATTVHATLYGLVVAMPLAGFLGSVFSGHPILFFGMRLPLPGWDWPQAKRLLSALHEAFAWAIVAVVAAHVAAALLHISRRDGIFGRMWPLGRGGR